MDKLLSKLQRDFPAINFRAGEAFTWSPKDTTVVFVDEPINDTQAKWSLLHEVGHGLLEHQTYATDFELVRLEAAAWERAVTLARTYKIKIDQDHIQDCLDTYRDWLHQRSACPTCRTTCLQRSMTIYSCYNCNTEWRVSRSRLCRPYRRLQIETAK